MQLEFTQLEIFKVTPPLPVLLDGEGVLCYKGFRVEIERFGGLIRVGLGFPGSV